VPANILAEEMIRITTEGVAGALTSIDALGISLAGIGGASLAAGLAIRAVTGAMGLNFGSLSRGLRSVYQDLRDFARVFAGLGVLAGRLTFGGSLGLAGIITGSARGTEEGFRFGQALEYLTRVLGEGFAPYVRMVTQGMIDLANWFRNLSDETKNSIAQWSLLTAGFGAAIAIVPMLARALASVFGVLAAITSPTFIAITAIAALTAAAARMFGFFESGGADAADALNASNQSWIGSLIRGVGAATVAVSKMFNWILTQSAKISDFIAEMIAGWGEALGMLPAGTFQAVRAMPPIQAPQIDVAGVDQFFQKVQRGAGQAAVGFDDLLARVQRGGDIFNRLQRAANFGQGFQFRMTVGFEGLQQTFERLQKGLAETDAGILERQLAKLNQLVEFGQDVVSGMRALKDAIPAVR
jgi:hypothetical protein